MDEFTLDMLRDEPQMFDALIDLMHGSLFDSLDCGDEDMNKKLMAFISNGVLLRIFVRIVVKWYHEHEDMTIVFEQLGRILTEMINCLRGQDIEDEDYENIWRKKSQEIYYQVENVDGLIKQVAEKVFQVPKALPLDGPHPQKQILLGCFLSYLRAFIEEIVPSRATPDIYFKDFDEEFQSKFLELRIDTIASEKDQVARLTEGLSFLITFLDDKQLEYPIDILEDIDVMANKAGKFCCTVFTNYQVNNTEIRLVLSDLLQKMEHIKDQVVAYVENLDPGILCRKILSTNASLLVAFGNKHLEDLMKRISDQIHLDKNKIEILANFLNQSDDLKDDLMAQIARLRDEVEYLISSNVAGCCPHWYTNLRLSQVIDEIQFIKTTEKAQLEAENKWDIVVQEDTPQISAGLSSQMVNHERTQVMVDFNQEREIMDHILSDDSKLKIISIVGMPGLGKTTLAKKIYDNPIMVGLHPVRIWCSVSRAYQKKRLLLNLLSSLIELTDEMCNSDEEDLQLTLYRHLSGKGKYLIIMDDVWDTKPWDDLNQAFPKGVKGSRIIFTSRIEDLKLDYDFYAKFKLSLLTDKESWRLLKKAVFQDGKCQPPELKVVGKEIAKKCHGLPLLVQLVAALLRKDKKEVGTWEDLSRSLSSRISRDDSNVNQKILEQTERLLEQSYNHLPVAMKPCFLYCASFPKEKAVQTRKLIRLWIAEGFITETKQDPTLEKAAETVLTDLIHTNLLLDVDRRSNGSLKTCRLHALVHDFCQKKAEEVNFLRVIDSSFGVYEGYRCLAINDVDLRDLINAIPFGSYVYSFRGPFLDQFHHFSCVCSFLFKSFKLLKVLDLEAINIYKLPREIENFVLLKYLAVRCDFRAFPTFVAKLWNLETCILNGNMGYDFVNISSLSDGMCKLSHLYLGSNEKPIALCKEKNKICLFPKVQTLSGVLIHSVEAEESLKCFPELLKLKCTFGKDFSTFRFPALDFLDKLETLNISYKISSRNVRPRDATLRLPVSLKQLTLSSFCLPWKVLSTIGTLLDKLQVLKLLNDSFVGKEWDIKNDDEVRFPELETLKLEKLNIENWRMASGDQFPKLKKLLLLECSRLKTIPTNGFAEMNCLKRIEMKGCTESAIESAKKFYREQKEDEGNENLELIIHASS